MGRVGCLPYPASGGGLDQLRQRQIVEDQFPAVLAGALSRAQRLLVTPEGVAEHRVRPFDSGDTNSLTIQGGVPATRFDQGGRLGLVAPKRREPRGAVGPEVDSRSLRGRLHLLDERCRAGEVAREYEDEGARIEGERKFAEHAGFAAEREPVLGDHLAGIEVPRINGRHERHRHSEQLLAGGHARPKGSQRLAQNRQPRRVAPAEAS